MTTAVVGCLPVGRTSEAQIAPDRRATPENTSIRFDGGMGISRRSRSSPAGNGMEGNAPFSVGSADVQGVDNDAGVGTGTEWWTSREPTQGACRLPSRRGRLAAAAAIPRSLAVGRYVRTAVGDDHIDRCFEWLTGGNTRYRLQITWSQQA